MFSDLSINELQQHSRKRGPKNIQMVTHNHIEHLKQIIEKQCEREEKSEIDLIEGHDEKDYRISKVQEWRDMSIAYSNMLLEGFKTPLCLEDQKNLANKHNNTMEEFLNAVYERVTPEINLLFRILQFNSFLKIFIIMLMH